MGPFSNVRSVVDWNVVMQRMTVQRFKNFTVVFQRIKVFWGVMLCCQCFPALYRTTMPIWPSHRTYYIPSTQWQQLTCQ